MNICSTITGGCGRDFLTVEAFDEHRVGTFDYTFAEGMGRDPSVDDGRRCLDLEEMEAAGWTQDRSDRWRRPAGEPVLTRVEL